MTCFAKFLELAAAEAYATAGYPLVAEAYATAYTRAAPAYFEYTEFAYEPAYSTAPAEYAKYALAESSAWPTFEAAA
jgi:hypothetical protein